MRIRENPVDHNLRRILNDSIHLPYRRIRFRCEIPLAAVNMDFFDLAVSVIDLPTIMYPG